MIKIHFRIAYLATCQAGVNKNTLFCVVDITCYNVAHRRGSIAIRDYHNPYTHLIGLQLLAIIFKQQDIASYIYTVKSGVLF